MARKIEYLCKRIIECGFIPVALSGDMGGSNTETQKELGCAIDPKTGLVSRNSFIVRGNTIHVIADPAHLVKNWRNGLFEYDFIVADEFCAQYGLPSNKVSFEHIRALARFSMESKWKYGAHLDDDYFLKDNVHFDKMNVQLGQ